MTRPGEPRPTPRTGARVLALVLAFLAALLVAGCGGGDTSKDQGSGVTLTVLAASSLTEVFPTIADSFTAAHPDVTVRFSFAGSQELVAQVENGAPADVVALAGTSALEPVAKEVSQPVLFARNQLTIVVPPGNPAGVQSLADLADPNVAVVLAAPEVPAGLYAQQVLDGAGLTVKPVSQETDVKAVVSRVALGGADAGIVYVTDARAAGTSVSQVPIPDRLNVTATYPAATIDSSAQGALAEEFVQFLLTNPAQTKLRRAGFLPPAPS
ncbi:MAG: molybdate ABC transporter substrate-binding protein [Actinomycetes bacterium]